MIFCISPQVCVVSFWLTVGIVSSIINILFAAANVSKRCVTTKVREKVDEKEAAATKEINIVPDGLFWLIDIK